MQRPDTTVLPLAALAQALQNCFAHACGQAVSARGAARVAVTGGSLMRVFGPALVDADVDWTRLHVYFGDERAVPPADPLSNFNLARETWLVSTRVRQDHVHRMPAELEDLDLAAREYEATLFASLGPQPRFDLVLLGVGPDGDVCSLFPGRPQLSERERLVVPVFDSPKPPARRLTLTLPALAAARSLLIVATGREKAPVARQALIDPLCNLPVASAAHAAESVLFLLDPDAASLLET
jgi:6-phosphogluconolactonase